MKNLRPVLTERGKIKIGVKGATRKSSQGNDFQPPQKLDHFVVTTLARDDSDNFRRDEEIHRALGDKPTSIPVRLIFDDIDMNMQTRYVAFEGRTIWCQGDGERATRGNETIECPCRNLDRDYDEKRERLGPVCKINGRLQVIIDNAAGVGGVWVFRTTSWNTVQGLVSSMALIANITGGRLAGVPLDLTVRPKQATDPKGRQQTIYVVGLEYRGSMDELRERAYQAALQDAQQGERLQNVRLAAAKMIAAPVVAPDEESDVVEEFYPEQAKKAVEREAPIESGPIQDPADAMLVLYDTWGAECYIAPSEVDAWLAECIEACTTEEQLTELVKNNEGNTRLALAASEKLEGMKAKTKPQSRTFEVHDGRGNTTKVVGLRAAAASYEDLKAKSTNPINVAIANLELLANLEKAAKNGLKKQLQSEIATARSTIYARQEFAANQQSATADDVWEDLRLLAAKDEAELVEGEA